VKRLYQQFSYFSNGPIPPILT